MPPKTPPKKKPISPFLLLVGGILGASAISALAYLAFGRDSTTTTTTLAAGSTTTAMEVDDPYQVFRAQPVACGGTLPAPHFSEQLSGYVDQQITEKTTAIITTSCGDITVELDPALAPAAVNNFVFLSRSGFYDGIVFHRIVQGFMAQTGDPIAAGYGGPGYSLPDESPGAGFVYQRGVVAMARAQEVSGSQFFIVTGDASHLPADYNVLGRVVDGWEALSAIDAVPVTLSPLSGEESFPIQSVFIEGITIAGE